MQTGRACELFGFDDLRALGLHFTQSKFRFLLIPRSDRVGNNSYLFAALEEPQYHSLYCIFGCSTDDDELIGLHFGQESFDARLIEGIRTSFVEDDLSVCCVSDLLLPVGAVDTVMVIYVSVTITISVTVFGVNFAGTDDRYTVMPRPGHYSSDISQNSAVVPDTGFAAC
jgi:hypothetical protein